MRTRMVAWLPPRRQPTFWTLVATVVGAVVVIACAAWPAESALYRSVPSLAAFETAASLAALLAAHLLAGRSLRTGTRRDLVLAWGFATLALGNFAFGAIPAALSGETDFTAAAQVLTATAGSILLAYACVAARGSVRVPRLGRWTPVAAAFGLVAVTAGVAALLTGQLDTGSQGGPNRGDLTLFAGDPLFVFLRLVGALAFATAAVGAARIATRQREPLLAWFAGGAMLGAAARLTYAMIPQVSAAWVTTGDLLRLAFYLLLIIGAAVEISYYQRRAIRTAVSDERRRIAREVHDGLAQDLSMIARGAADLDADGDAAHEQGEMIRLAARRAMTESRALLDALTEEGPAGPAALEAAVVQVAALHGLHADCRIEGKPPIDDAIWRELRRIAVEAIHNAARHGRASSIEVSFERRGSRFVLSVSDDGRGFDPDTAQSRFGLVSMRERAQTVGARLRIESRDGEGTTVEVVMP